MTKKLPAAADLWREKLEFLLREQALATDPSQKFSLRKQIEEAEAKLRELAAAPSPPVPPRNTEAERHAQTLDEPDTGEADPAAGEEATAGPQPTSPLRLAVQASAGLALFLIILFVGWWKLGPKPTAPPEQELEPKAVAPPEQTGGTSSSGTPDSSSGQARGVRPLEPGSDSGRITPYRKKLALVIGIDRYGAGVPGLSYAVRDARAVRDLLRDHLAFDRVVLLEDEEAERSGILSTIVELNAELESDDQFFFFFAGHGISFREDEQEIGYLLPQDTSGFDEPSVAVDAISMTDLRERVTKLKAKHILLAIDACFGGYAARSPRGVDIQTENYLRIITTSRARQIITAGQQGQKVYEDSAWGHSAFTYKLLEGLGKGLADGDGNGLVIAAELYTYLSAAVTVITQGAQTPQYAELSPDEGQFVFVLPTMQAARGESLSESPGK